jgi:YidC/Oxa1 family membrane protein insertase
VNKTELSIVVGLFVLLLGWGFIQKTLFPSPPPAPRTAEQTAELPSETDLSAGQPAEASSTNAVVAAAEPTPTPPLPPAEPPTVAPEEQEPAEPLPEEELAVLSSGEMSIVLGSHGGGIREVTLQQYRQRQEQDSPPVVLDFSPRPALSMRGVPELSTARVFDIEVDADGRSARLTRELRPQVVFTRSVTLGDGYRVQVEDAVVNTSTQAVTLGEVALALGPMSQVEGASSVRGMTYLGVDTLAAHGGEPVVHWGKKRLPRLFGVRTGFLSCARPDTGVLPMEVEARAGQPVSWAAAKNKFFVQLLEPATAPADCVIGARREAGGAFSIERVSASLTFPAGRVEAGGQLRRSFSYYVGPKKYDLIKTLGKHQSRIMEFGWLTWLCRPLLTVLNLIYAVVRNYGVAIIVLTALVRLIFWPVTHKSTESMKKMQKVQPLVNAIRQKYKDNPQRMNQEVMALYKEHKVNPMSGCLPMVVQIPVFIALFSVLRSAVELRFAPFLWIRDLSEPENLLVGVLPLPLNILPLFMTATMVWQQHLTPTAGDPQQKKMMAFMPVVMLFIFYNMPSALVLYWSTSQCLAIAQLLIQKRRGSGQDDTVADAAPRAPVPARPKRGRGRK